MKKWEEVSHGSNGIRYKKRKTHSEPWVLLWV